MNLYEATLQIARSIKDAKLKASALGSVVAALERSGDQKHSEAVFQEVLGDAQSLKNQKDADSAFGLIALGLIQASNIDKAWQIINLISDPQNKDSTLCDMAMALADSGTHETALEFARAIQEHTLYKSLALQHIAYALVESGKFDKALKTAQTIQDIRRKSVTFMKIATALAETGNVDQALEVAHSIDDEEEKSYLLIDIAAVLAEAGHIEQALDVARTVQHEPFKTYAFLDISKNILSLNLDEAKQTALAEKIMKAFKQ